MQQAHGMEGLWETEVGCACHDGHNAVTWAHQTLFSGNKVLLENIYAGIAACKRNCPQALVGLPSWLVKVVDPHPDAVLASAEDLREFWTQAGAPADLVDVLCDMRLTWCPHKQAFLVREVPQAAERLD